MVVQRFARFRTNLGNLCISQDICYVRMMDNNGFLTIYGHRASLLNNKYNISEKKCTIYNSVSSKPSCWYLRKFYFRLRLALYRCIFSLLFSGLGKNIVASATPLQSRGLNEQSGRTSCNQVVIGVILQNMGRWVLDNKHLT